MGTKGTASFPARAGTRDRQKELSSWRQKQSQRPAENRQQNEELAQARCSSAQALRGATPTPRGNLLPGCIPP